MSNLLATIPSNAVVYEVAGSRVLTAAQTVAILGERQEKEMADRCVNAYLGGAENEHPLVVLQGTDTLYITNPQILERIHAQQNKEMKKWERKDKDTRGPKPQLQYVINTSVGATTTISKWSTDSLRIVAACVRELPAGIRERMAEACRETCHANMIVQDTVGRGEEFAKYGQRMLSINVRKVAPGASRRAFVSAGFGDVRALPASDVVSMPFARRAGDLTHPINRGASNGAPTMGKLLSAVDGCKTGYQETDQNALLQVIRIYDAIMAEISDVVSDGHADGAIARVKAYVRAKERTHPHLFLFIGAAKNDFIKSDKFIKGYGRFYVQPPRHVGFIIGPMDRRLAAQRRKFWQLEPDDAHLPGQLTSAQGITLHGDGATKLIAEAQAALMRRYLAIVPAMEAEREAVEAAELEWQKLFTGPGAHITDKFVRPGFSYAFFTSGDDTAVFFIVSNRAGQVRFILSPQDASAYDITQLYEVFEKNITEYAKLLCQQHPTLGPAAAGVFAAMFEKRLTVIVDGRSGYMRGNPSGLIAVSAINDINYTCYEYALIERFANMDIDARFDVMTDKLSYESASAAIAEQFNIRVKVDSHVVVDVTPNTGGPPMRLTSVLALQGTLFLGYYIHSLNAVGHPLNFQGTLDWIDILSTFYDPDRLIPRLPYAAGRWVVDKSEFGLREALRLLSILQLVGIPTIEYIPAYRALFTNVYSLVAREIRSNQAILALKVSDLRYLYPVSYVVGEEDHRTLENSSGMTTYHAMIVSGLEGVKNMIERSLNNLLSYDQVAAALELPPQPVVADLMVSPEILRHTYMSNLSDFLFASKNKTKVPLHARELASRLAYVLGVDKDVFLWGRTPSYELLLAEMSRHPEFALTGTAQPKGEVMEEARDERFAYKYDASEVAEPAAPPLSSGDTISAFKREEEMQAMRGLLAKAQAAAKAAEAKADFLVAQSRMQVGRKKLTGQPRSALPTFTQRQMNDIIETNVGSEGIQRASVTELKHRGQFGRNDVLTAAERYKVVGKEHIAAAADNAAERKFRAMGDSDAGKASTKAKELSGRDAERIIEKQDLAADVTADTRNDAKRGHRRGKRGGRGQRRG